MWTSRSEPAGREKVALGKELPVPQYSLWFDSTGAGKQLVRLDHVSVRELNSDAISKSCHSNFRQEGMILCSAVGYLLTHAHGVEVDVWFWDSLNITFHTGMHCFFPLFCLAGCAVFKLASVFSETLQTTSAQCVWKKEKTALYYLTRSLRFSVFKVNRSSTLLGEKKMAL